MELLKKKILRKDINYMKLNNKGNQLLLYINFLKRGNTKRKSQEKEISDLIIMWSSNWGRMLVNSWFT